LTGVKSDEKPAFRLRFRLKLGENRLSYAAFCLAAEPHVNGVPLAELFERRPPRAPVPAYIDKRAERRQILYLYAPPLLRQQFQYLPVLLFD
jgi:hypothetical protein